MARLEKFLRGALRPHGAILFLFTAGCTLGLIAVFLHGWENTIPAYGLYALSAYTLLPLTIWAVSLVRTLRVRMHRNPFLHRFLEQPQFRAAVSLRVSLGVTAFYSLYKGVLGVWYRSAWFGSMAFYYIVLGVMRFVLVRGKADGGQRDGGRRAYRLCAVTLLILTAALGAMSFQAIYRGEVLRYPGFMIYAAAAFAFYNLTMGIVRLVRRRKWREPVYLAAGALSLASALVSLFFLQVSLLAAFGDGGGWERDMNIATGTAVYLAITGMAVFLLRAGRKTK